MPILLDEAGQQKSPLHWMHINDAIHTDINEHIFHTVCARVDVLFAASGEPTNHLVPSPLSNDKFQGTHNHQRKMVGWLFDSQMLTVGLLPHKRCQLNETLRLWTAKTAFNLLEIAHLVHSRTTPSVLAGLVVVIVLCRMLFDMHSSSISRSSVRFVPRPVALVASRTHICTTACCHSLAKNAPTSFGLSNKRSRSMLRCEKLCPTSLPVLPTLPSHGRSLLAWSCLRSTISSLKEKLALLVVVPAAQGWVSGSILAGVTVCAKVSNLNLQHLASFVSTPWSLLWWSSNWLPSTHGFPLSLLSKSLCVSPLGGPQSQCGLAKLTTLSPARGKITALPDLPKGKSSSLFALNCFECPRSTLFVVNLLANSMSLPTTSHVLILLCLLSLECHSSFGSMNVSSSWTIFCQVPSHCSSFS